ncbi:hypothetical protein ACLKA6_002628 [Drosophila palustris]
MIETVNTIDNNAQAATVTLHKAILLENQVGELSRACQFAKAGLVNSNLLDEFEVRALLKEMDSLPYQSAVEATEFAKPIVVTNGTTLLYILALPKVIAKEYQMLVIRPSISSGKQVDFNHGKLLVAPDETFAITSDCLTIGNTSVCAEEHLAPLNEAGCIPRILKGGNAECHYVASNRRVVELLEDGTLFLTNYNGIPPQFGAHSQSQRTQLGFSTDCTGKINNLHYGRNRHGRNSSIRHRYCMEENCTQSNFSKKIRRIDSSSRTGGNRYANRPKTYVICGTQIFEEGGVNTIRCGAPLFPPPLCSACLCPMIRRRFSYYRSSTRSTQLDSDSPLVASYCNTVAIVLTYTNLENAELSPETDPRPQQRPHRKR